MVLLPDHMHMLWELPEGDIDYIQAGIDLEEAIYAKVAGVERA